VSGTKPAEIETLSQFITPSMKTTKAPIARKLYIPISSLNHKI
jgi:hypothetical protein